MMPSPRSLCAGQSPSPLRSQPLLWALAAPPEDQAAPCFAYSCVECQLSPPAPVPLTPIPRSEGRVLPVTPKLLLCLSLIYVSILQILGHLLCAGDTPHGSLSWRSSTNPSPCPPVMEGSRTILTVFLSTPNLTFIPGDVVVMGNPTCHWHLLLIPVQHPLPLPILLRGPLPLLVSALLRWGGPTPGFWHGGRRRACDIPECHGAAAGGREGHGTPVRQSQGACWNCRETVLGVPPRGEPAWG